MRRLKNSIPALFIFLLIQSLLSAGNSLKNQDLIKQLYRDSDYLKKRAMISHTFEHTTPGHWGEFVKGVDEDLVTRNKIVAFTFDACGGPHGSGYDQALIELLRREKVPATLFVTGKWIDKNLKSFLQLSRDTLFEIENHGFNHQPCSIDGESAYGIKGTPDVPDAFDEIEANEIKINILTGRRPLFYRSATAFIDEAGVRIAQRLGVTVVSFDVLSGDAVPGTPAHEIEKNVLEGVRPGAIIIMHFNRPEWNSCEALEKIIPALRMWGYTFARLKDFPLKRK
ncbi:MAG: polysaccharide deacetylase family protein [Bacteroidota bacterium]|nr:polysaccharide deacetylase family protein [Bacteroidota bacterium]